MTCTSLTYNLDKIQAGILKPHGRDFVKCLFFTFGNNPQETKEWISHLAITKEITSAQVQIDRTFERKKRIKEKKFVKEHIMINFLLSATGYRKLFPRNSDFIKHSPVENHFRYGMKPHKERNELRDPCPKDWQKDYQGDLDGLILLAGNSKNDLDEQTQKIKKTFFEMGGGVHFFFQDGKKLFYREGDKKLSIEPFGFRDGLSQPIFLKKNEEGRDFVWDDKWKIVLDENLGSYMVFRKLEQDVIGFQQKILELANKLKISKEFAEAQVMGRFKDGTPLTLFDSLRGLSQKNLNSIECFNNYYLKDPDRMGYESDTNGNKCPFHAHIRQTNPRNDFLLPGTYPEAIKVNVRIVRRGIPYEDPDNKTGLLFMCYQKSIKAQFFRIQKDWVNNPDFISVPKKRKKAQSIGLDPIVGQFEEIDCQGPIDENKESNSTKMGVTAPEQLWNKKWGTSSKERHLFNEVVSMKGGEYFYAPPISFLEDLENL